MTPDFTTIGVSLVVGVLSSYLTFRLQFERFKAMDERRELDWVKWRDKISIDVEALKQSANLTQLAVLTQVVESLVKRVEDLWKYASETKHVYVDPYVREVGILKQRVDELEKK